MKAGLNWVKLQPEAANSLVWSKRYCLLVDTPIYSAAYQPGLKPFRAHNLWILSVLHRHTYYVVEYWGYIRDWWQRVDDHHSISLPFFHCLLSISTQIYILSLHTAKLCRIVTLHKSDFLHFIDTLIPSIFKNASSFFQNAAEVASRRRCTAKQLYSSHVWASSRATKIW